MIAAGATATTLRLDIAPACRGGAFRRRGEPVVAGLPLPSGAVSSAESVRVVDRMGSVVPAQSIVQERWKDGSIRWLLVRFFADTDESGRAAYTVAPGATHEPAIEASAPSIQVDASADEILVNTGRLAAALADDIQIRTPDGKSRIAIETFPAEGRGLRTVFDSRVVEEAGPLYARVRMTGRLLAADGGRVLDLTMRLEFHAGLSVIGCAVAITNPHRAKHPGGIWELGDPNSVLLRAFTVRVELLDSAERVGVRYSLEPDKDWDTTTDELVVHQESSGGEAWASRNHVNAAGLVPLRYKGYNATAGSSVVWGARATPIVQVAATNGAVALATAHFWENFPKTIRTSGSGIAFDLFPPDNPDTHEIQPGERKTHRFTVLFGNDSVTERPLAWVRQPLLATPDASACLAAEALPFMAPFPADPAMEEMIRAGVEGAHSFFAKREFVDEYGWRHFGDLYADHETVNSGAVISHYNNQYDAIAGFAAQFLRTGDARWWSLMDDLAAHVVDIDIYHTSQDKSAYSGGLFWHTYHYTDAGRSAHRSYPGAPGIAGGGPSNEHNYSTGLMLHHLLTGAPESREAAIGLAEWVLAMDDGAATPFRWLAPGSTGLASSTASTTFHGPGRGAGNSICVLLNAHRLTDERRFLEKAESLIARCIGPSDDIDALNLLDAERRWSYTVFLQALGRYLLHKVDLGEQDEQYAYARASLLHYARWMVEHEYPYLDKPEILEYPTETWAAQDLRKAEVFVLAARCAAGLERDRFIERAEHFHARSLEELQHLGTWWLTRPLVILLSCTGATAWWRAIGCRAPAMPNGLEARVERRREFVPQRARAVRRARAGGAVLLGAVALATLARLIW